MGSYSGVLMVSIALLQCFSIQVVITKTSDLNHNKDDPQYTSTLRYLTNIVCEAALQCTEGHSSKSSSGCHLADGDTGDLYKKALKHILNRNMIIDHDDDELITVDDSGLEGKKAEAFLMVSNVKEARDVYKVSMKSGLTEKTGICITDYVNSLVYDRISNTLLWSQGSGIFKQVIGSNSKQIRISLQVNALWLNVYNNTLYYVIYDGFTHIYTQSLNERRSQRLWFYSSDRLKSLSVNAEILCWIKWGEIQSISCFDITSKIEIYTRQGSFERRHTDLTLLKAPKSGMLLFLEHAMGMYHIKSLKIAAGKRFGEPKEITHFVKGKHFYVANSFLIYTFYTSKNVEVWKLTKNGTVGGKAFTSYYPSKGKHILGAFL